MSDLEERPSKIRKLEPEDPKASLQNAPELISLNEKEAAESTGGVQDEANGLPQDSAQDVAEGNPPLSKNQLKKLRRQQQWEAGKEWRKAKKREKHKEKQARKATATQEAPNSGAEASEIPPAKDKRPLRRPIQVPIALILDCDFTDLMTEKELISLGAQLTRCYSDNRNNPYRTHMVVSSWGGKLKTRFETVLANHHRNWKGVTFLEPDFQGAAQELDAVMRGPMGGKLAGALSGEQSKSQEDKSDETSTEKAVPSESPLIAPSPPKPASQSPESALIENEAESTAPEAATEAAQEKHEPSIVYLTSDSPHTLDVLSPNTSYIIGGIVDKNRHKGLCYKRACERGIPTAKLPIGEYMTMQSRTVLAVNHVMEIMLKWLETGDWGEAFLRVIPKRKEAKLKVNKNGDVEGGNNADGEDAEAEDEAGHEEHMAEEEHAEAGDEEPLAGDEDQML